MKEPSTRDPGRWFILASVAAAVGAAALLAFAPMVAIVEESSQTTVGESISGGTASPADESTGTRVQETRTLPETQGWGSVAFVAGPPLVVAALPLLARRGRLAKVLRTLATVLLFGWVLLGALSIGIFYLPSAGLMLVAAILAFIRS